MLSGVLLAEPPSRTAERVRVLARSGIVYLVHCLILPRLDAFVEPTARGRLKPSRGRRWTFIRRGIVTVGRRARLQRLAVHEVSPDDPGISYHTGYGAARTEVAQRAGHSKAKTTGLYDRRNDDVSVGARRGSGFERVRKC